MSQLKNTDFPIPVSTAAQIDVDLLMGRLSPAQAAEALQALDAFIGANGTAGTGAAGQRLVQAYRAAAVVSYVLEGDAEPVPPGVEGYGIGGRQ